MTPAWATELLQTWGYPAYYLLFLAAAFGSPVTEDLLLLMGGYLVGTGLFTWPVTLPLAYAGILSTDVILFLFGRRLREHTLRRGWIRRLIRPGRLRVATRWFARFGDWVVFFARLVPGTRMIVFVSAGVRGLSVSRFIALDGLASLLYVPALLGAGATLGEQFGSLGNTLAWVGDRVLWLVGALAVVLLARWAFLRREVRRFPSILEDDSSNLK